MHPCSKHWHLIDYVTVRRTDRQDVRVTKTLCGADCWTDHRLVVRKLKKIQPARRPQGKKAPKRLDVSKLNQDSMRQAFLTDICNQLDAINLSSENPEENWTVFHKTVHSSTATTLGLKNASSEAKMQRAMDQVSQSCHNYDLTISTKTTEVVHQPAPVKPYNEPTITVNGQKLKVVDNFIYLGSTLSRAVHIYDEVTVRIANASVAFGRLRANVWERNGIKLDTKLKVYKALVLPTLLYACETWTVYQRHAKILNHFHLSCLRKLLKIKWQDKIPDREVLKKAGMQSMHTVLKLAQLRWTGHVIRMPDERLPKKVFYGELPEGKRPKSGQTKRYKDTLKASLKDFDIPVGSWEQTAQER